MEVYQQQIEMEKLNHQGELMLKKATGLLKRTEILSGTPDRTQNTLGEPG